VSLAMAHDDIGQGRRRFFSAKRELRASGKFYALKQKRGKCFALFGQNPPPTSIYDELVFREK